MLRFIYILFITFLISCSNVNFTEPTSEPERQSIFGGPLKFSTETGSFSTGKTSIAKLSNDKASLSSMPINELLWKSTLDTLDFMVFENIDPFGGVIITKWFINEKNENIRSKITVSFSSSELKATSIKVSVTREKFQKSNWVADGFSDGLARKIEDLILSRARELRNNIS